MPHTTTCRPTHRPPNWDELPVKKVTISWELQPCRHPHLSSLGARTETQLSCHVVHTLRHRFVGQFQQTHPQLHPLQPLLQSVDLAPLSIKAKLELVLFPVNIHIPLCVALGHSLSERLDLGHHLIKPVKLPLQSISLFLQ